MMSPDIARQLQGEPAAGVHQKLLDLARKRIEAAERRWSQRHERFRESERLYRAFRVPDTDDQPG
jgi:hypothetical protein